MRRYLVLCLGALALCGLLCGCASSGGEESLASYTVNDARALVDAGAFDGMMEEVDSFIVSMLYGIGEESITECVGYLAINTSVSADEVTVLVMADEQSAIQAEEACRRRVESQIDSCSAYCPDQVPRLEDAVILRRGNTVLLAVGNPDNLPRALAELALN